MYLDCADLEPVLTFWLLKLNNSHFFRSLAGAQPLELSAFRFDWPALLNLLIPHITELLIINN